jgi:hypothetical protein
MLDYEMGFIHLYNGQVAQVRLGNPKKTPPLCLVKGLQGGRKGHMKSICYDSDDSILIRLYLGDAKKFAPHFFCEPWNSGLWRIFFQHNTSSH